MFPIAVPDPSAVEVDEPIDGDRLAEHFGPLAEFGRSLCLTVSVEKIAGSACGYHEQASGRVVIEDVGPAFSTNVEVSLIDRLARRLEAVVPSRPDTV